MKFNPVSRRLYTDDHELIKQLDCRQALRNIDVQLLPDDRHAMCGRCDQRVVATAGRSDEEILRLVRAEPSTCLMLALGQDNVRVIPGHA